ncbi:uncharacterized protein BDR25DRAFT_308187 [Lindgomyces ingoldianus]|uniref:Uncharacterized protein n=1 Tax=Lindgomyces ingoldianus TaxID=673940 RepID=A0ACB6Q961_9PLEO|nr:uncharacterized protein BDR25DRAFT_308187 [Lindgomyces ingoldianus]KAF2462667.1 hypothetical protein BDR25DRAFT_308187 [Lindgomyces ingoldianus]
MSSPTAKSLTKRAAPSSLMPPPPAPKRIKRPAVVLDEDTYVAALTHIIRRDFFPGLAETDAQMEYLSALDSGNNGWIRESGRRLTEAMTPGPGKRHGRRAGMAGLGGGAKGGVGGGSAETPSVWAGDTPLSVAETDAGSGVNEAATQKPDIDLNLSLTAFQAKYTPEDQESFNQILDKANAKRFLENQWLHIGNRHPSKQRLAQQKVITASTSATAASTSAGKEVVLRPSHDLDARPAAPTTHKHTAFNSLMFVPDSIESWAPTRAQEADSASLAPPKALLHHNTRLPTHDPDSSTKRKDPPSPTISAIRDAIAGRPRTSKSEAGYEGSETPRVNGYAFVDATPPEPEDEEEDAPTDLLEKFGANAKPSPFTIHDSNRRERLHHKMVERISGKRAGKTEASSSISASRLGLFGNNTPRFLSAPTPGRRMPTGAGLRKDAVGLTPAGRRLLEKVGGSTPKREGGFGEERKGGGGLDREWTPTPKVKRRI